METELCHTYPLYSMYSRLLCNLCSQQRAGQGARSVGGWGGGRQGLRIRPVIVFLLAQTELRLAPSGYVHSRLHC